MHGNFRVSIWKPHHMDLASIREGTDMGTTCAIKCRNVVVISDSASDNGPVLCSVFPWSEEHKLPATNENLQDTVLFERFGLFPVGFSYVWLVFVNSPFPTDFPCCFNFLVLCVCLSLHCPGSFSFQPKSNDV